MNVFLALPKLLLAGFLLLVLSSCETRQEPKTEDGFIVCTMADILQNPGDFDQKKVKVPGVFSYRADNAAIRRNWPNSSDQIGLDFSASVEELGADVLGNLKEEKIVISGIYYMNRKGPQNQYQGTIECLGIGGY